MSIIIQANARYIPLPDQSVHCVVTSPPYWGLRDYKIEPLIWDGEPACEHEWANKQTVWNHEAGGASEKQNSNTGSRVVGYNDRSPHSRFCQKCGAWRGCLGLETTPELFVKHLVGIFREIWRVLRDDGTCWVNLGDSYCNAGSSRNGEGLDGKRRGGATGAAGELGYKKRDIRHSLGAAGIKHKDLCGIPWRVALALQADGWVLRSDICWAKPNPMPESVTDRCTKSHEYVFMFCKARWAGAELGRFASISDEDARWIALFLDTEGNICAKRTRAESGTDHFGAQICFANTSRSLLDSARSIIGAGTILSRPGKNAAMYYLQMSNVEAADLLHRIYPFLIVKRRQARLAMHLQRVIAESGRERRTKAGRLRGRLRDDEYTDQLVAIWARMKALNHFSDPDLSDVPEPSYGGWKNCADYFYDALAIAEPSVTQDPRRPCASQGAWELDGRPVEQRHGGEPRWFTTSKPRGSFNGKTEEMPGRNAFRAVTLTRNKRTVWTIATQAFPGAHFATFPEELPATCVRAGTSERGCCPNCGAPWDRVIDSRSVPDPRPMTTGAAKRQDLGDMARTTPQGRTCGIAERETTGWQPTCECNACDPVPCTVLDPFCGSGTTGVVCRKLGRKFVGLELNPTYCKMSQRRIESALLKRVGPKRRKNSLKTQAQMELFEPAGETK